MNTYYDNTYYDPFDYTLPRVNHWDYRFLEMAKLVSCSSKDPSTKCGAVIARDKRLVTTGFNGFPQGMPDTPELYANREEKYSRIIHAEVNALLFAKEDVSSCTLYTVPFMPCDRCIVLMLQAGIRKFVAPRANEEQLARWGAAFERTRKYVAECGGHILEVDNGN